MLQTTSVRIQHLPVNEALVPHMCLSVITYSDRNVSANTEATQTLTRLKVADVPTEPRRRTDPTLKKGKR